MARELLSEVCSAEISQCNGGRMCSNADKLCGFWLSTLGRLWKISF